MIRTTPVSSTRAGAVTVVAVLVLLLGLVGAGVTVAQYGPVERPLATDATPGEAGVENEFTFAFNASEVGNQRSVLEIRIDFDDASGVDAAALSEDDVSIEGEDTGTPGVDATAEEAPGVLLVTASDTFTLDDEDGILRVNVTGVEVPTSGTFDSEIEFLDDREGDVISLGTDEYTIDEESPDPAEFDVSIADTNSPVTGGESLQVEAGIENVGDVSGAQTVELSADGLGSDDATVSLSGGESTTETLTLDTSEGDAGSYAATVTSDNDSASTTVEVRGDAGVGPLTAEAIPAKAGVENEFTFAFDASEISDERSILDVRIYFDTDEMSGVDVSALSEDDVSIAGESTGTPGVDATREEAPGILRVTAADTFTLADEDGVLTISASGVEMPNGGTFTAEVVFLDDEEAEPVAYGNDQYTIEERDGPQPVVEADRPQDPDGDGLYEDIDGNGEFTVGDVQQFFQNRDADAVRNNAEFFNFDGGGSPDVSVGDVQALFIDLVDEE